jgi:hypothetical protein
LDTQRHLDNKAAVRHLAGRPLIDQPIDAVWSSPYPLQPDGRASCRDRRVDVELFDGLAEGPTSTIDAQGRNGDV